MHLYILYIPHIIQWNCTILWPEVFNIVQASRQWHLLRREVPGWHIHTIGSSTAIACVTRRCISAWCWGVNLTHSIVGTHSTIGTVNADHCWRLPDFHLNTLTVTIKQESFCIVYDSISVCHLFSSSAVLPVFTWLWLIRATSPGALFRLTPADRWSGANRRPFGSAGGKRQTETAFAVEGVKVCEGWHPMLCFGFVFIWFLFVVNQIDNQSVLSS